MAFPDQGIPIECAMAADKLHAAWNQHDDTPWLNTPCGYLATPMKSCLFRVTACAVYPSRDRRAPQRRSSRVGSSHSSFWHFKDDASAASRYVDNYRSPPPPPFMVLRQLQYHQNQYHQNQWHQQQRQQMCATWNAHGEIELGYAGGDGDHGWRSWVTY